MSIPMPELSNIRYSSALQLASRLCSMKVSNIRVFNALGSPYQFFIPNSSINDVAEANIINELFYIHPIPKVSIPR